MKPLDNLCHPVSVIREAEELAADAFGAAHAFLMVGGTTSSVQSMVLTACKRGDEIILPRNVHRSVLNALVLCGAIPVYVNPEVDQRLGISLGMKREQVAKAIAEPLSTIDKVTIIDGNGEGSGVGSMGSYVPQVLAKTMESVKEVTGIDIADIMRANTYDAKVNKNVNITGLDGIKVEAPAEAGTSVDTTVEEDNV